MLIPDRSLFLWANSLFLVKRSGLMAVHCINSPGGVCLEVYEQEIVLAVPLT